MSLSIIFNLVKILFTNSFFRYAAGRLNLISPRELNGLDVFVRTFSLPSVIFMSLAQMDMSTVNWRFLGSILLSKTIIFVGVLIVTLCLSRPIHLGKLGLYAVFCTQSNDFAIGYTIRMCCKNMQTFISACIKQ